MESNYEAGDRVSLARPYILNGDSGTFIPSGEFVLLVDGPHKSLKYGSTIFTWDILSPCGKLIKITEDYF
jgi:hypothetical protein